MPPRAVPTARQLRLGTELRKLRERRGLTAREAGELIDANQARISNIETGRFGLSEQRVRKLADHYDCTDTALVEALVGMTGRSPRGWWEDYREILSPGQLDLAECEHHATGLRTATVLHIPGLLQTVDYARAVFRAGVPPMPPPDIEHRISFRIKRQAVLHRDDATPLDAVVHESALRIPFGGPEAQRAQLQHLVEASERPRLTLRIVPFDSGAFPGAGQPVLYATGPVPQLDTVQLDQYHGVLLLDAEDQLRRYRLLIDRMEAAALSPSQSRDFIRSAAQAL